MSMHVVGRNGPEVPEVLCRDANGVEYWRAMEVSHYLGHPTAQKFDSHAAAWRAADMHGGVAVAFDDYQKYFRRPIGTQSAPPELRRQPRDVTVPLYGDHVPRYHSGFENLYRYTK